MVKFLCFPIFLVLFYFNSCLDDSHSPIKKTKLSSALTDGLLHLEPLTALGGRIPGLLPEPSLPPILLFSIAAGGWIGRTGIAGVRHDLAHNSQNCCWTEASSGVRSEVVTASALWQGLPQATSYNATYLTLFCTFTLTHTEGFIREVFGLKNGLLMLMFHLFMLFFWWWYWTIV